MWTRGTSNANVRGNTKDRRARREWLLITFRANVDLETDFMATAVYQATVPIGSGVIACRCYRCGKLLTLDTVNVDRIIPGCQGGTYRRTNIRPSCARCGSETGATTRG